jgi:hypothetical protein
LLRHAPTAHADYHRFRDEAVIEANEVKNKVLEGNLPTKFEQRESPIVE